MNGLVYDIEIVNGIPDKKAPLEEGINYCKGWSDHEGMEISVVGVYDYKEDRAHVFCKDNLNDFFELARQRSPLIGFNNVGFDNKVLNCWGCMPSEGYYDILREIWISVGLNPEKFYWKTHGGYKLDTMGQINNLGGKTGHGALAPIQWQKGQIGSVIDYCLQDVMLTRDLFDLCSKGPIKSPKGGTLMLRKAEE